MSPVVENGIVFAYMRFERNIQTRSDIIDAITKSGLPIEAMPFFTTG